MPELAEVYFHSQQWNPGLGRVVRAVVTHPQTRIFREVPAEDLESKLRGQRLERSECHGKKMCFVASGNRRLGIHLGMTGELVAHVPGKDLGDSSAKKYEHLALHMDNGWILGFRDYRQFGRVWWSEGPEDPDWWKDLPPQPQEEAFTREHFEGLLAKRPRTPLKGLLLEQDKFPGVGNWMADEILWRARLRPRRTPAELGPVLRRRLYEELVYVSRWALRHIGRTYEDPPESWLFPHRWRDGGACPQTGRPLRRETISGRTSCWSPSWQR